jgi:malonate transporter
VIASETGFRPPSVLLDPLTLLGAAAVPTALIALGASLYRPPARTQAVDSAEPEPAEPAPATAEPVRAESGLAELAAISVLKLVVQPAVALAAGFALALPHAELVAVVVCAGLPTAQNAFIYAQRYRAADDLASRSIMVTTTLSMATLIIIAALLGR